MGASTRYTTHKIYHCQSEPTHDEYDSDRLKWLLFDCRGDGKGWGKGKGGKGKGGKGKGKGKW